MAKALVLFLGSAGAGGASAQKESYAVVFRGADVSEEIATGQQIQFEIDIPSDFSSSAINAEIVLGVMAKATELGLTVTPTDIRIPAYETGQPLVTSFWTLDEVSGTRLDSIGTNHLTDVNAVGSAAAPVGLCANFIAANSEHLSVPTNTSLDLGDIDFSFMLCMNADVLPGVALSHYSSPGSEDLALLVTSGNVTLYVSSDGSAPWTTPQVVQTISLNTWYGVFFWHDSVANTINLQVDDGPVASLAHAGGVHAGTAPWVIGSQNGTDYWDGRIWNVRFAKQVWTAEERAALLEVLG